MTFVFGSGPAQACQQSPATKVQTVARDRIHRVSATQPASLPETDRQGAVKLAQRLRAEIEQFPYSELLKQDVKVTASVGVATVSQKLKEPNAILKTADRALYRAKNGGRNMVCYDSE